MIQALNALALLNKSKRYLHFVFFVVIGHVALSQPTVLGTSAANGAYVQYDLNAIGGFKQYRLQAASSELTDIRNWEFTIGTAASPDYTTNWRPYTSGNTLTVNDFIPTTYANGAKYNAPGGASGLLPAITNGNYYTFNVGDNAGADNVMMLMETTYNPVTVSSVTQAIGPNACERISITTSATPNASEYIYVRYSSDGYTNSTLVQATGSGTSWTADIPWQSATTVSYYVYTSSRNYPTITGDVTLYGQAVHDMSTLNLNNNGGSNYSWTFDNFEVVSSAGAFSTGKSYHTLTGAGGVFDVLNTGVSHTGAVTVYVCASSTSENAAIALNNSTNWTSIDMHPLNTGLTISGSIDGNAIIKLNGASNVTIDGRVNGVGSSKDLIIENTDNNANDNTTAITIINNGVNYPANDIVKYCVIKAASRKNSYGNIYISAGSATSGLILDNNDITNTAGNRPVNGLFVGLSTQITISNNNFYDLLHTTDGGTGNNCAIKIKDAGVCTVTGNSVYETTALTISHTSNYNAIYINTVSASGHLVQGNFIGGTAPGCTGGTFSKTGSDNNFYGIVLLSVGTSSFTNVIGNTINNLSWNNSGISEFYGICEGDGTNGGFTGNIRVGTITSPNKIGDTGGGGNITYSAVAADHSRGFFYGITRQYMAGLYSINYNQIGGITINGDNTHPSHFTGIDTKYNPSSTPTSTDSICYNTVGSSSGTIICNSHSTSINQNLYGIRFYSDVAGCNAVITNNTVSNLTNSGTVLVEAIGIYLSQSTTHPLTLNVINNSIHDIASPASSANVEGSVMGIRANSRHVSTVMNVNNNTIYNLSDTNPTSGTVVVGLATLGKVTASNNIIHDITLPTSGAGKIYGLLNNDESDATLTANANFIYNLNATVATDPDTEVFGIAVKNGTANAVLTNNIINLGGTLNNKIHAIFDNTIFGRSCKLYFNTIYLGDNSSKSLRSYCVYKDNNSTPDYKNNIFYNNHTSTGGTDYAMYLNNIGGVIDYNDYYVNGAGTTGYIGKTGGNNYATLSDWQGVTGLDANSYSMNPSFTNAGTTTASDYSIAADLAGVAGTGVSTDYGNGSRAATGPTMGAWEKAGGVINHWRGVTGTAWNTATNWTCGVVPAEDANLIFDYTPANNCLLNADHAVTDITNASAYHLVANGHKLTIKGVISQTSTGKIDGSASSSTVEFAGGSVQSIPSGAFLNNQVYNLSINNASNVTLNGTLNLLNTISATSGKLDAITNTPNVTYGGTTAQTLDNSAYLNAKVYDLTIDNTAGVSLSTDFTVNHLLTVNSGKLLIIPTSKLMNVEGTISNTSVTEIVVKASQDGTAENGSLMFHNGIGSPVAATVEFYSKASWNLAAAIANNKYKWQFFGIPVTSATALKASPTFDGAYIRKYNEAGNGVGKINVPVKRWLQLVNESALDPFAGYEIVQQAAKTYTIQGTLVNADYSSGQLNYTTGADYPGHYIFSNPYTAAIDIKQLSFGVETEATVYQYDTGSYNDWDTYENTSGENSGQYIASPKSTAGDAGIPQYIPSMQGYLVRKLHLDNTTDPTHFTFDVPYNSVIAKNTTLQRSKQEEKSYTVIDVKGQRFADKVWIFVDENCSRSFDNGWDGHKMLGSALTPQLLVRETDDDLQISAVDDINNTILAFQPGEDTEYKLTFTHTNMLMYPELYLIDMQESKVTDITASGSVYTFTDYTTSQPVNRFKIVTSPGITTDQANITKSDVTIFAYNKSVVVNNKTNQNGLLKIIGVSGKTLLTLHVNAQAISTFKTNLVPGSYIAVFENAVISSRKNLVLE